MPAANATSFALTRSSAAALAAREQLPHLLEEFRRRPRHLIDAANYLLGAHRADIEL